MPTASHGARYHLPVSAFKETDLVIAIATPKPTAQTPHNAQDWFSDHYDEDRFKRHRKYLQQTYGFDTFIFRGYDDFQSAFKDPEPHQIIVDDVYGMYEVGHWPGAQKQKRKTKHLLRGLQRQLGMEDELGIEQDSSDDEEESIGNIPLISELFPSSPPTASTNPQAEKAFHLGSDDTIPLFSSSPERNAELELRPVLNAHRKQPASGDFTSAVEKYRQQQIKQAGEIRAARHASIGVLDEPIDIKQRIAASYEPRFRVGGTRRGSHKEKREQREQCQSEIAKGTKTLASNTLVDPDLLAGENSLISTATPAPDQSQLADPVHLGLQILKRAASQAALDQPNTKKVKTHQPKGNDPVLAKARGRTRGIEISDPSNTEVLAGVDKKQPQEQLKNRTKDPLIAPGAQINSLLPQSDASTNTYPHITRTLPTVQSGQDTQGMQFFDVNNENALKLPSDLLAYVQMNPNALGLLPQVQQQQCTIVSKACYRLVRLAMWKLLADPRWRDKPVTEVHGEARRQLHLQLHFVEYKCLQAMSRAKVTYDYDYVSQLYKAMSDLMHETDEKSKSLKQHLRTQAALASRRQQQKSSATTSSPCEEPIKLDSVANRQVRYFFHTLAFYTMPPDTANMSSDSATALKKSFQANLQIAALIWQCQFMEQAVKEADRARISKIMDTGFRWFKAENGSYSKGDFIIDLCTGVGKWRPKGWIPPQRSSMEERVAGTNVSYYQGQYVWNIVHPRINSAGTRLQGNQGVEVEFARDAGESFNGTLDMTLRILEGTAVVMTGRHQNLQHDPKVQEIGRRMQDNIQLLAHNQHWRQRDVRQTPQAWSPQQVQQPRPHPLSQAWTLSEPSTLIDSPMTSLLKSQIHGQSFALPNVAAAQRHNNLLSNPINTTSSMYTGNVQDGLFVPRNYASYLSSVSMQQVQNQQLLEARARMEQLRPIQTIHHANPQMCTSTPGNVTIDPRLLMKASPKLSSSPHTNDPPNLSCTTEHSVEEFDAIAQREIHSQRQAQRQREKRRSLTAQQNGEHSNTVREFSTEQGDTSVQRLRKERVLKPKQHKEKAAQHHAVKGGLRLPDPQAPIQQAHDVLSLVNAASRSSFFVPDTGLLQNSSEPASDGTESNVEAAAIETLKRKPRRSAATAAAQKFKSIALEAEALSSDPTEALNLMDDPDTDFHEIGSAYATPSIYAKKKPSGKALNKGGRRVSSFKSPAEITTPSSSDTRTGTPTEVERWFGSSQKRKVGRPRKLNSLNMEQAVRGVGYGNSSPTRYAVTEKGKQALAALSQVDGLQGIRQQLRDVGDEAWLTGNGKEMLEDRILGADGCPAHEKEEA